MNPIRPLLARLDRAQREHAAPAFLFGVVKKFGDDNAGVLASNLAYSAFGAIFPLLLLLVTLLGIVLGHDPSLEAKVLHSSLSQFPVIGAHLGRNIHALDKGSALALGIAILGLVWSTTGLAQAGLYTMAQVWNVPGPDRPGYLPRLARSLAFLATMGLGLLVTTGLSGLATFGGRDRFIGLGAEILVAAVNAGQYLLAFRVLTPKVVQTRRLWPGAVVGGVGWTILQAAGGYLVGHDLRGDSQVYGTFALVLGLLAWVYMGVQLSVYAAEVNTVLARRLWPRSLVQAALTPADRESVALQATQQQRRPEEEISVSFRARPGQGGPGEVPAHEQQRSGA